jgi:hypothetical protein
MPRFSPISASEIPELGRQRKLKVDRLAAYIEALRQAPAALRVDLEPGDNARGVAIRMQAAARRLGRRVKTRNLGGTLYVSWVS